MISKTGTLPQNEIQPKARGSTQSIQPPLPNEQNQPVELSHLHVPPPLQRRPPNKLIGIIPPLRKTINFRSFYKESGFF